VLIKRFMWLIAIFREVKTNTNDNGGNWDVSVLRSDIKRVEIAPESTYSSYYKLYLTMNDDCKYKEIELGIGDREAAVGWRNRIIGGE